MFKSLDFTYDGKSSTDYGLVLASLSKSGVKEYSIGVPLTIEEHKIKRNPKPLFLGTEVAEKLQFEVEMIYISPDPLKPDLTRQTIGSILKWLVKSEYHEFRVIDEDYSNIIYNCIFTEPQQINYDQYTFGLKFVAVCDRPWGYKKQTISKNVAGNATFIMNNPSFYNGYIFPEVEITLGAGGGNFSIINNSDNGRSFTFTELAGDEVIYVNNERNEIISNNGINRNNKFNFNWFRIAPTFSNSITINGTGKVEFRIEFPMPM